LQSTATSSKEGIILQIPARGMGNADRISEINSLKNQSETSRWVEVHIKTPMVGVGLFSGIIIAPWRYKCKFDINNFKYQGKKMTRIEQTLANCDTRDEKCII